MHQGVPTYIGSLTLCAFNSIGLGWNESSSMSKVCGDFIGYLSEEYHLVLYLISGWFSASSKRFSRTSLGSFHISGGSGGSARCDGGRVLSLPCRPKKMW